ncbi:MAG: PAS domain S-box protein [Synechococcales bacterium]|nr:PAS domain S-box protein [Synechococcales bacterium]
MSQNLRTLLIVDDSPEDRELYRRYLKRNQDYAYTILEADLGQQGLELWERHRPDAALLDYWLPDLNGLEFLAQLKPQPQQPLPVIMVTGQGSEAIAVRAMKAGAQDYLIKEQITPEGLHLAVNGAIAAAELRTQLQQRVERERLVSQITRKIHQTLDLEEILQTTVDEVRRFLQTDRVLIFRLHPDGQGTVISESAGPGWTPLLSTSYRDPCLSSAAVEPFRQGHVTLKPDIYDGSVDPCHMNLLAKLEVRANLVVPILQNEGLWGMLIAHHCAAPRQWHSLEVDLLQDLATQVGIALQQAELYQRSQAELVERRRVEAELRESEIRFRQLAENIEAAFWVCEYPQRRVSYISPAYERLWGLNAQDVLNSHRAWTDLVHPNDQEATERAFQEKALLGEFDQEYRVILPDGRVRWVRDRCFPIADASGQIYRLTGLAEDITDRKQQNQALSRSETLFRTSVENMLDCFGIYSAIRDSQGRIVDFRVDYVNDAACANNLMTREAQIGRGLCEILPGHVESGLFAEYCQVVETGQPLVKESLIYEDGYGQTRRLVRAFDIRVAKFNDGFVSTWRDVTDRQLTQIALRDSQAQIQKQLAETEAIYQSAPVGLAVLDTELRFVRINQRLADINGLSIEAHIGRTVQELLPDLAHYADTYLRQVLETGEPLSNVEIYGETHAQPGVKRVWLEQFLPLKQGDRVIGINVVCEEVTDRIRVEAALRESEDRLRLAVESAQLGTWDWDLRTNELKWDVVSKAVFGLPPEAEVTIERFFEALHPGDRQRMEQVVAASLDPAGSGSYEAEFRAIGLEDGVERWIAARGQAYFDFDGSPLRFIGTVMDISDRKQAEQAQVQRNEELRQLNQTLQAATEKLNQRNQDLNQFAHVVSHDLKAPLRGIRSLSEWLQEDLSDQIPVQNQEQLQLLVSRVDRMEALINDLLAYSRIGRIEQPTEPVDVTQLVQELVETLLVPPSVTIQFATNLPVIQTKRILLSQVLANLLSNAVKYGCPDQQGKITISVCEREKCYEFAIADNGPGIAPSHHEKIFGIFETIHAKDRIDSTGIGLAIVKKLVEAEGGTIRIESEVDAGAVFYFTWPRQSR